MTGIATPTITKGFLIYIDMEIFRTDGGGKSYADERLFRLISNITKFTHDDFFENVSKIQDHKGTLNVYFDFVSINEMYLEYCFSVFITFWRYENEYSINFYNNNKLIKS